MPFCPDGAFWVPFPTIILEGAWGYVTDLVSSFLRRGPKETLTSRGPKTLRTHAKLQGSTPGLGTGMLKARPGKEQQLDDQASSYHERRRVRAAGRTPLLGGWHFWPP